MPRHLGKKTYFQTNEAAKVIGVSRQTLLRWFREKRVDDVKRDRNGWRLFADEDIKRIKEWAMTEKDFR